MSIIVAKIEKNECLFLSDTRVSVDNGDKSVTGGHKLRKSPSEGVLKIHILSQKVCIAFAGDVLLSAKIIQSLVKEKPKYFTDTLQFLQDKLKEENNTSEFIVCLVSADNVPTLYKINKDKIESENSFWTGELKAYDEFQSYFLTHKNSDSIFDKSRESFRKLVNNSNIETIGDFTISAIYNSSYNSFHYETRAETFGVSNTIKIGPRESVKLTEGTTQEGAFVLSSLISNNLFRQAICLFFSKGKTGYFYLPISEENINIEPEIFTNININELVKNIDEKYQFKLIGNYIDDGIIRFIQ